ncbi:glycoside hydrolase family 13 protein [Microdochium trichocladiopsis]|uniref:Glycoside hydrolase family 13 protein n=1 Tax=Microdochium trichocladiopsis TaxID=1682393 RepID=A0A9P8YG28_9PEZI|nr:glycoside hydrolase family 13 protein [Microdochium trichocladiopsis]KAH7039620.1 glycoside hydrolase family 13 protein [Microdochium trichocladiopsis]
MTVTKTSGSSQQPWWKNAAVYQVYPASFMDTNGDGMGDLAGITSKLDYLDELGIDVVWICPMYDSPQYDLGYDISNYEAIYKPYGDLKDMQRLIDGCHARGMRIIVDLVINHTSHMHAWFQESRSSTDNPKRDWYIWKPARHDPATGKRLPPNNWRSNFGGSAWTWDEATGEYYLHLFASQQPDLNWENEETRRAIYDSAMRFWLDRGVDGFRIDTVNMYSKTPGLPDAPVANPAVEWQRADSQYCNGPRMHEFLAEMNAVLAPYGTTMTVGELPHTTDLSKVLKYVSAAEKQLDMVFQFDVVDVGFGVDSKYATVPHNWQLPDLKRAIQSTQHLIKGTDAWTTAFMENHDQARSVSRFGCDAPEHRVASGRMLALLNTTLSGTLFIYQGQEIGMVNVPKEWPLAEYKDIESTNYYREVEQRLDSSAATTPAEKQAQLAAALAAMQHLSRDNARVPMAWDSSNPQAGFSANPDTWMRTHDLSPTEINVAAQLGDDASVLEFWRRMLKVRKQLQAVLVHGDFELLDMPNQTLFSYTKTAKDAFVVLNFSSDNQPFSLPELPHASPSSNSKPWSLTVSTSPVPASAAANQHATVLEPWEGRLYISSSSSSSSASK